MERVKILIIGAGAVGLATAQVLSQIEADLVVVDKEASFGRHTSSRNSEVIHAGHYYEPGSLKARLCVSGNKLLYDYLRQHSIPHENLGKVIVATTQEELATLNHYQNQGALNGCGQYRMMSRREVEELEPAVKCVGGLQVPSTGIFDTHKFMQSLAYNAEENGAFVVYGMEVISISPQPDGYVVEFSNKERFHCRYLINSAGLWADEAAAMAGIDTRASGLKQHWCKGQYFKISGRNGFRHLIYPVADPKGVFLGIHLTLNLNGEVRFGPNAYYVDEIDYRFNEGHLEEFHRSVSRYLDIDQDELKPDDTGIRPKLQGPGEGPRDFYIREESSRGLPGFINLIGIESPGLTSSLAIARLVSAMIN